MNVPKMYNNMYLTPLCVVADLVRAGDDGGPLLEVPDRAGPSGETRLLLQGQDGHQHPLVPRQLQEDCQGACGDRAEAAGYRGNRKILIVCVWGRKIF